MPLIVTTFIFYTILNQKIFSSMSFPAFLRDTFRPILATPYPSKALEINKPWGLDGRFGGRTLPDFSVEPALLCLLPTGIYH